MRMMLKSMMHKLGNISSNYNNKSNKEEGIM